VLRNIWKKISLKNNRSGFSGKLIEILGSRPNNINIFQTAFLHKSCSTMTESGCCLNNERLEYLGDAVLGTIITEHLYKKYPDEKEGFLTKMRSRIVNGENLGELAHKIGLPDLLVYKNKDTLPVRHIYGDVYEAFIGAIFIDKGYKFTRKYILQKIIDIHIDLEKIESTDSNYKSQLIEWCQKNKKDVKFYTDNESNNSKRFISFVRIGDSIFGSGTGLSKKEAEQNAAQETFLEVNVN